MIDEAHYQRIAHSLPFLQSAESQLSRDFRQRSFYTRIPVGRDVFLEGDDANAIALLISGVVRVYKIGASGREITLYRFGYGESCILTANAILSRNTFPAIATVEEQAEAIMVPADTFREWVSRYDAWRDFVFDLLAQRLASVLAIVDEVVFQRVDTRLAAFLLERCRRENPVRITHQDIAYELGSSREVVSRILEDFANRGLLVLGRGRIDVIDPGSLANQAVM
jgi:CRP/FNR family transcriptional regulator